MEDILEIWSNCLLASIVKSRPTFMRFSKQQDLVNSCLRTNSRSDIPTKISLFSFSQLGTLYFCSRQFQLCDYSSEKQDESTVLVQHFVTTPSKCIFLLWLGKIITDSAEYVAGNIKWKLQGHIISFYLEIAEENYCIDKSGLDAAS